MRPRCRVKALAAAQVRPHVREESRPPSIGGFPVGVAVCVTFEYIRRRPDFRYVCTPHRFWIGPPDAGQSATPLGPELADIIQAQWRHLRLHHGHIRPVLVRDWSPEMDGITSTIWASQTTLPPGPPTPNLAAL